MRYIGAMSFVMVFAVSLPSYSASVELSCLNQTNFEGAARKVATVVIDTSRQTVNGRPAQFADAKIIFKEINLGVETTFVIDRQSLQMAAQDSASSKWNCSIAKQ